MSQRVLVFGDTHIPSRRDSIPKEFYDHIEQTNYDIALITGDLVRESEMLSALPPLPRKFTVVGNMDYGSQYNFHEQIQLDDFNVLLSMEHNSDPVEISNNSGRLSKQLEQT